VRELERRGESDAGLWASLADQGWLALAFPASLGGADGGLLEAGILVEEVQRRAALVPTTEVIASAVTLHRHGRGERAGALLQQILAGDARVVPALLEAGDRFGEVDARVDRDGRLVGEKHFVDHARFATHHLVAARRDGELGLHLVDAADPAVSAEPTRNVGRTPQCTVRYAGAAAEPVCDERGHDTLLQVGRALCAAQALACMQKALELTVAYTAVRKQFDRPLASFQAVQHHAANMAIQVESAEFLVHEALDALERGEASHERVAIAKAAVSEAAPEVVMLAHQLHGGQGFIEENDLYFFSIRAKERSLAWGSVDECLAELASGVDRPETWL
jgi:alkylation response protein AidB-like acyl-CoA dehydrogenase